MKKRDASMLNPIKERKSEIQLDMATFDIETHEWTNFIVGGFYCLKTDTYFTNESMIGLLDSMMEHCEKNKIKTVFAHAGGKFDFNFLLDAVFNYPVRDHYCFERMIPRGSGMLSLTIVNEMTNYKVTFRDSLALFPTSLRDLGKALGVEVQKESVDFKYIKDAYENFNYIKKLFSDEFIDSTGLKRKRNTVFYNGIEVKTFHSRLLAQKLSYESEETGDIYRIYNKDDVLSYLKADCVSLAQCLNKFYSIDFIQKAGAAFTIAGQSVKVFQTYLKKPIFRSSVKEDAFVRLAYFGGRTEIFKHIFDNNYDLEANELKFDNKTLKALSKQKGKTIYCYDVNSLYPTVMHKHNYPTRFLGFSKKKKDYDPNGYGVWHCKVRVPTTLKIPPLGIQHTFEDRTSKLIFPTGEFEGHWTIYELEYAKRLGVEILEFYEGAIYAQGEPIFKEFIGDMYARRLKAQKEGDETTRFIVKLIMNSTYGKLGQVTKDKKSIEPFDIGLEEYRTVFNRRGERILLGQKLSDPSTMFSKVIIPCYVTSYARVYMHREMMKAGEDNVFYTDTDSIFTTTEMETGDELGAMKEEYKSNGAVFVLPKTYSIDDIIGAKKKSKKTMKGMTGKMAATFSHRDFYEYQLSFTSEMKAYAPEKFDTIKTAMRKGCFLSMSNSVKDEEKRAIDFRDELYKKRNEAKKKGDHILETAIELQLERIREGIFKVKEVNYRSVKSKYDKRLKSENEIDTDPIILGLKTLDKTIEKNKKRGKNAKA